MVSTARDVAGLILARLGPMDAWKLQKLTYYSQAWALAWDGRPLFADHVEAWAKGPVTKSLYNAHRGQWTVSEVWGADLARLSPDAVSLVDSVLSFYGKLDGFTLSRMTHEEQPWLDARGDTPEGQWSDAEITQRSMREFYAKKALRGEPAPTRQLSPCLADPEQTVKLAREEMVRWRDTLDWLAVR